MSGIFVRMMRESRLRVQRLEILETYEVSSISQMIVPVTKMPSIMTPPTYRRDTYPRGEG